MQRIYLVIITTILVFVGGIWAMDQIQSQNTKEVLETTWDESKLEKELDLLEKEIEQLELEELGDLETLIEAGEFL